LGIVRGFIGVRTGLLALSVRICLLWH
jgi:hypothetical protein